MSLILQNIFPVWAICNLSLIIISHILMTTHQYLIDKCSYSFDCFITRSNKGEL